MAAAASPPRVARRRRRRALLLAALAALLAAAVLLAAGRGGVRLTPAQVLAALVRPLGWTTGAAVTDGEAAVLWAVRLPRVVAGVLVGGVLGVSGAAMQGLFRNPLVDPGLLGVSSGAALFAALAIVAGGALAGAVPFAASAYVLPLAAFAGSVAATVAVDRLARFEGKVAVTALLLAGIAVNALAGALIGVLTYAASDAQLRTLTFWTLGSLSGVTWRSLGAASLFLVAPIVLLPRLATSLNALLLGEAEAGHLGVAVERTKAVVLALVALGVGASVALAGVLGFVGLVVPHLLRLAVGPDHRALLAGSALLGASLLVIADLVARTAVVPAELPLGILTAGLGTPFFLVLLVRERGRLA